MIFMVSTIYFTDTIIWFWLCCCSVNGQISNLL